MIPQTPVTFLAAAALALLQVVLMLRVSLRRGLTKTGVGDAGDIPLVKRIRAHGNLAENAALFLILLYLIEASGQSRLVVASVATVFVIARLSHAVGISRSAGASPLRVFGATATALSLAVLALLLFYRGAATLAGQG